ncbi:RNA polymerase recycling motor ATPase HelR [Ornithinimicrobium avium]|uniref:AAA family ATPase n=1 Tax=Ornithinimicrobium avium TaxID=2283195 RepID=A0A345NPE4_9MICO|nr:RNA polymerase recycling motor ATPase HelR [Ornithinimicrobium avium]AXH96902.1 AAA family ATPase [Ornithinimicrobium avium]
MTTTGIFELAGREAKAAPGMVEQDEAHLAAVAQRLEETVQELADRLAEERRAPAGGGQTALERDQQVHRLSARLRVLERYGQDLCLGRMVLAGEDEPVYVGRLGLSDGDGERLLVDWRSPAAEPFFAATHADPMGLVSRRRYRWARGRVVDYWDEVFTADGLDGHAALDDQSAFIASLGEARSSRMRDVLGTLQADQDAIIRADSRGALVVDGGPGTGKTVVALHRAAYLLYADPRLGHHRGGVLFVGPHTPYLAYVEDVLPSLGEEGVRTCTLRTLLPEGAAAVEETDAEVARLKSSAEMVRAVEPAVALHEEPPTEATVVTTEVAEVVVTPDDWAEAFGARDPATPHNLAREEVLDELVDVLVDRLVDEAGVDEDGVGADAAELRQSLHSSRELRRAVERAWPLIEPTDLVGDLWDVPAYLRRCAPWLTVEEVRLLQRDAPQAWTVSDLPLLDAARQRLGDTAEARRRRRQEAALAEERRRMADVVDDLVAHDDSEMQVMSMLRGQDLRAALDDVSVAPAADPDRLAGPFLHVVVDEAQELTDAQWQMLLRRCPSRSFTIVGDRAQARHGFAESWEERLRRVGLERVERRTLTINYRTPAEVMAAAEPVIRAVLPDADVPVSIRSTGVPVRHVGAAELDGVLTGWLADHEEGMACVVTSTGEPLASVVGSPRVRWLSPELVKGLEFDLVVIVEQESFGDGVEGPVDRYVSMTRATGQLVIVTL